MTGNVFVFSMNVIIDRGGENRSTDNAGTLFGCSNHFVLSQSFSHPGNVPDGLASWSFLIQENDVRTVSCCAQNYEVITCVC